jgi:hypothetical protein
MSSLRIMIGLVAGVTAASLVAAAPPDVKPAIKAKAKVSKVKKSPKKTKQKPRKQVSARELSRSVARGDNMPAGFTWPPSPAMIAAGKACEAELDQLGLEWTRAEPEGHINDPIVIASLELGGIQYTSKWRKGPHKLDCLLARSLSQIGFQLRELGVREVVFGSIYRWTPVRTQGTTKPVLSRHALGLAMDIVEFIDDTGKVSNVKQDYLKDDPLLLAIEKLVNESGKFRIVLTPRNDPRSHYDHFHIEANPNYSAP